MKKNKKVVAKKTTAKKTTAKKTANERVRTFVGIADCHGVESFMPIEKANVTMLQYRAESNPQRHAVVYSVDLTDGYVQQVEDLLETASHSETPLYHYKSIVRLFKGINNNDKAITKGLGVPPINLKVSSKDKWRNIPNSKLDPYYKR